MFSCLSLLNDLQVELLQRPGVGLRDALARGGDVGLGVEQAAEPHGDGLQALRALVRHGARHVRQLLHAAREVVHPVLHGAAARHGVAAPAGRQHAAHQRAHHRARLVRLLHRALCRHILILIISNTNTTYHLQYMT